jgi:hypothetical protein
MQFIIMHKTNAHWEAGAIPTPELIGRVGGLINQLAKAGALLAGEGLRPSSEGVRVSFSSGTRSVTRGPFEPGNNELPAAFSIVRAATLDEAIEWASAQASVLGDGEVDIRPVTEAWDIGIGSRPPEIATRRYMVLRKATAATEAGIAPTSAQRAELARLVEETGRENAHLATVNMRPSARGRRYKNSTNGVSVVDGPFAESKELVGGYVIVSAESLDAAGRWAEQYFDVVHTDEVDVRELE